MNTLPCVVSLLTLAFAAELTAQIQVPVNPKATYLRINNDLSAVPSPGIPLSAVGAAPGQFLNIKTVGLYADGGGSETDRGLVAVFSSTITLLPNASSLLQRVPDAIAAGPHVATAVTYYAQQSTDIPQDFVISRNSWDNGVTVQVPPGAAYIFLCVLDPNYSYFGNNTDANNDFKAEFTVVTPDAMHGTGEHCELKTGVNGTATLTPTVKQAAPFATVSAEIHQAFGVTSNLVYILAADVYATGGTPPVGPLPGVQVGSGALLVQYGITGTQPALWSLFVPPGYAGTTIRLQGVYLDPEARNGLLSTSDAHRIELQ